MKTKQPTRGVFITGTDTEVGKTFVGALLVQALVQLAMRVAVYKPVASGSSQVGAQLVSDDARRLWEAAGRPLDLDRVCPQQFVAPVAPPVAASMVHQVVDDERLLNGLSAWADFDVVVVEGAGGWMSPLSEHLLNADLAHLIDYPVILVVPNRLGMINQALSTITAIHHYKAGLQLAGVIINDVPSQPADDLSARTNHQQLARWTPVPILAHIRVGDTSLADARFVGELLAN